MDRMRPVYVRQQSNPGTPGAPASPVMSPLHRHARSGSTGVGNVKKAHTKAAAQRLAQVMAHQLDDDDDEDDLSYEYTPASGTGSIGLAAGRGMRSRSPMSVRSNQEHVPARPAAIGRPSLPNNSMEPPSSVHLTPPIRLSHPNSVEQSPSARSLGMGRLPQPSNAEQPPSARSMRSSQASNAEQPPSARTFRSSPSMNMEQPPSARSTSASRPHFVKPVSVVPASIPISLKPTTAPAPAETPVEHRRERSMLSVDWDNTNFKDTSSMRSNSALQDELDMLQEENDSLLEKLRLAEERCEEAEARTQQLEKQIATLGEGTTLEARLLSRKEAALQQREAALRVLSQKHGRMEDIAALRVEAETARDEVSSAMEKLYELRAMNQRAMLTQEEKEEVVLKRCWLARYWNLCVRHGIHGEIAEAKHNYWSSFAPCPLEVVLDAGQRAKEENSFTYDDSERRYLPPRDLNENSGELTIESMLLVEKGLRELVSLKVEDAVLFAMAQQRRRNTKRSNAPELRLPTEGLTESYELSEGEAEDVQFKQAWLTYFWRRAKNHGLEDDIAEERLMFWINQAGRPSGSHDAVAVERGLLELRKLGIETQLWEESRRGIGQDPSNSKSQNDF
ncbi:coiled-coil domain-containing protein SCD2-like isoform X2 [Punica granatum]|uniref:Coiled-coil domain-containing protein SCD2-like isoform X2 n=1 Tax=Punica granatum TaxID=22663 RepID=A0A6P8DRQ1_PUNGR|nr:coiled-coil domain-containing protein SCD2-like isoform X2 [Punica granatum]